MREFMYLKPSTLKEASDMLIKYGDGAHVLNGGTDLITRIKSDLSKVDYVIDIKYIEGLKDISFSKEKGLFIGACATLNEIMKNKDVAQNYPILVEAISLLGSTQIRNRATCVGNLCNASPLADTATPILAMDGLVHIYGEKGEREISIHEFFTFVRQTSLMHGDIVRGISIPYDKDFRGYFHKTSRRREVDLSTVCASVAKSGRNYRIALGAVAPTPIRARKTEDFLKGKELNKILIKEAADLAVTEISPIDDVRSTKEYRTEIVKVLLERGLEVLMKGDESYEV